MASVPDAGGSVLLLLLTLMMLLLSCSEQGDEELLPFKALASALQSKEYYSALSLARDCANPIMHVHLSTIDVMKWRQQAVRIGPPDKAECQVPLSQAVISLGFYQPAPLLRRLRPFPDCCVFKPAIHRAVADAVSIRRRLRLCM